MYHLKTSSSRATYTLTSTLTRNGGWRHTYFLIKMSQIRVPLSCSLALSRRLKCPRTNRGQGKRERKKKITFAFPSVCWNKWKVPDTSLSFSLSMFLCLHLKEKEKWTRDSRECHVQNTAIVILVVSFAHEKYLMKQSNCRCKKEGERERERERERKRERERGYI